MINIMLKISILFPSHNTYKIFDTAYAAISYNIVPIIRNKIRENVFQFVYNSIKNKYIVKIDHLNNLTQINKYLYIMLG